MAKPFEEWTVLPHGRLIRLEDNLLTVTGRMRMPPMGEVERRMSIVRLPDFRLVVYSAIALHEAEMKQLEAFGTPAYLVVPSDIHRMDSKIWKERYPTMKVVAPPGARARVEAVVPVDLTDVRFDDPNVQFLVVPGTGGREAALRVETPNGTTLIVNDVIFNLRDRPGLRGWFFHKIGMTGDTPRLPKPVKMRQVKDEAALRAQLEHWSQLPRLTRVIVAHGDVIVDDAAGVLRRIADQLAA